MIELFLSTDGKHTVHVSAETFEELTKITPQAKALYQKVLSEFGGKVRNGINGANRNGETPVGKRIDTVEQAREVVAPQCPKHQGAMVYRQGRRGSFWSCPVMEPDGKWCKRTREVSRSRAGDHSPALVYCWVDHSKRRQVCQMRSRGEVVSTVETDLRSVRLRCSPPTS